MKSVMFTKHLEGYDLGQIMAGIKQAGLQGADLCVRPGYPVHPANCRVELPAAARRFAAEGLSIALVTTPGDFNDPAGEHVEDVFAACSQAGIPLIKLGYWTWTPEGPGYWKLLAECRCRLEGFARLAAKYGVKACVHTHSGRTMGLNACAVMNLVRGFDPNHVGVFLDVGHLSLVGEPLPMALDIVWDHLALLALKDLCWQKDVGDPGAPRQARVVPLGYGLVEWAVLVRELKRRRFDGTLSFHCEYAGYPPASVLDQAAIDVRLFQRLWEATPV